MSQAVLDLKTCFVGHLAGEGEVFGLTGRRVRAFKLDLRGEWSIGHDALHLDETATYLDGRELRRHWALQFDGAGGFIGYDSNQAARLRGKPMDDHVRLVFDRPLGLTQEISAPRVVLKLNATEAGVLHIDGRVDLFGLPLQRMRASLNRV